MKTYFLHSQLNNFDSLWRHGSALLPSFLCNFHSDFQYGVHVTVCRVECWEMHQRWEDLCHLRLLTILPSLALIRIWESVFLLLLLFCTNNWTMVLKIELFNFIKDSVFILYELKMNFRNPYMVGHYTYSNWKNPVNIRMEFLLKFFSL